MNQLQDDKLVAELERIVVEASNKVLQTHEPLTTYLGGEATDEATKTLTELIAKREVEARIDELTKAVDLMLGGSSESNIYILLQQRLAQLKEQLSSTTPKGKDEN